MDYSILKEYFQNKHFYFAKKEKYIFQKNKNSSCHLEDNSDLSPACTE